VVIFAFGDVMKFQIGDYVLDEEQTAIVLNDAKYTLVVAGAGSGKTLTILGKLYYLVYCKHMLPEEIICISFTRASANSLHEKILKDLHLDIDVYTFHRLALRILRDRKNFEIASDDLLESITDEFFRETIFESDFFLKKVLQYFDVPTWGNFRNRYCSLCNHQKMSSFKRNIVTFIHLFKCHAYSLGDFNQFLKDAKRTIHYTKYKKEKIFLLLAMNIYLIYQHYLEDNSEVDFDDLIIKAQIEVKNHGFFKKISYVIVDEYQDTSYIRFLLVKTIINSTCASLLAVGDDFQSIYRFTGCDVSLFLNFCSYFKGAKVMKISHTYRNSQELIDVANAFIRKNPYQIRKKLVSSRHLNHPVKIVYYDNIKESFLTLVLGIYHQFGKPILVLGRNNFDIYKVLDSNYFKLSENGRIIHLKNKDIMIQYLTIHRSKGLESENVVIINLEDGVLGFPNQIKNDSVLRFVTKDFEKYPFSEERRLFYVALTRTKNYVYLLVPKHSKSVFALEIEKLI